VPPAKTQAVDDGMNKLERQFWGKLQEATQKGVFADAWREPFKFQVIGSCRWYTPDFVTRIMMGHKPFTIWETKGFLREDAALKLIAAASRYPCFEWVLVRREQRIWNCSYVTAKGIARDVFTPRTG
jgi:hypothetical protein